MWCFHWTYWDSPPGSEGKHHNFQLRVLGSFHYSCSSVILICWAHWNSQTYRSKMGKSLQQHDAMIFISWEHFLLCHGDGKEKGEKYSSGSLGISWIRTPEIPDSEPLESATWGLVSLAVAVPSSALKRVIWVRDATLLQWRKPRLHSHLLYTYWKPSSILVLQPTASGDLSLCPLRAAPGKLWVQVLE